MADNKKSEWEKLDWAKKVEICMQGIDHEDSLLITFMVIFVALEAMFFAAVFSEALSFCLNLVVAVLAISVAVYFICIFKWRGDYADDWGAILYSLWKEVSPKKMNKSGVKASEIMIHYKGCKERREKKWHGIVFGWGKPWKRFRSPRLFISTYASILIILVWIFIIVNQVLSVLDC